MEGREATKGTAGPTLTENDSVYPWGVGKCVLQRARTSLFTIIPSHRSTSDTICFIRRTGVMIKDIYNSKGVERNTNMRIGGTHTRNKGRLEAKQMDDTERSRLSAGLE